MKKLLLIDGHSLIHRAYHAYPKTLATGTGELTNAVYGFTNILLTAINEVQPTHLAVTFDLPKPTFRQAMFVGYKRSRVKPDDELITQIPRVKEVVKTLNIPIYEVEGFEADDVIGTLCRQAEGKKVVILTSDRDLMQLIRDDTVVVQLPAKGKIPAKTVNESDFLNGWGFAPKLLPDYKALAGDQSDDIPGVGGIGQKTAKLLVSSFGAVNDIYISLGISPTQVQSSKFKVQSYSSKLKITETIIKKLADGQDSAQLSKQLATIDINVPIQLDWEQTQIHEYDKEKVLKLFDELQFKTLVRKLPNDKFEQSIQDALF